MTMHLDWDNTPDSHWRHREAMKAWSWQSEPATWPDTMDASTCGDWVEQAITVLQVVDVPPAIRKLMLRHLTAAAHYCNKVEFVREYNFDDGELELVQALAGPYPRHAPNRGSESNDNGVTIR